MKIISTLASALAPFILILAPHGVHSHSAQVRHCITSANKLRIFLEQWHDNSGVGSGSFRFNVNTVQIDKTAISQVQGVSDTTQLPGCKTECTTLASECTNEDIIFFSETPAGTHNDWVWFDFDITDTVELVDGNGYILIENYYWSTTCESLFPVTITAADSDCGCACEELGHQCCIPGSPTQYEECVNDADLSLVAITKDTASGTKCCVHTEDPLRIIQQHLAFDCPTE